MSTIFEEREALARMELENRKLYKIACSLAGYNNVSHDEAMDQLAILRDIWEAREKKKAEESAFSF